jgi:hypothetical protein
MAAIWARMSGRGGANAQLPAQLKSITHVSTIEKAGDISKDTLASITQASHNEDDRKVIMQHLRECLAETSGKHWRRIVGSLFLLEELLKNGSPKLLTEAAEGRYFDLVQRLAFLEHCAFPDKRAQSLVRNKAEAFRKEVVGLLENASLQDQGDKDTACCETVSTCSGSTPTRQESIPSTCANSSDVVAEASINAAVDIPKRMILNNVVSVGHSDDTTSESESDEGNSLAPVRFGKARRMSARARNERSQQGNKAQCQECREPNVSAGAPHIQSAIVDLLDF